MADEGEGDWKDTNVGGIGSEEDKTLRKSAAQEEEAWAGAGTTPGLKVWRIEHFKVVAVDEGDHGKFYKGDSYIVLNCVEVEGNFINDIYFVLGPETSVDEQGTAAYKTVELDDLLDGQPTQHREEMCNESDAFKELFPNLEYLDGGIDSGFKHVVPEDYDPKFWVCRRIKGKNQVTRAPMKKSVINKNDCFILDSADAIYVLNGENASPFLKQTSGTKAENMEAERADGVKATYDIDDAFYAFLS